MHRDILAVARAWTWKLDDAQIRTLSSLMQLHRYLHICIQAKCRYAHTHICIHAIYAYMLICGYADMQYADMQYALYTFDPCSCSETNQWSYLLPLGKSSPAQGICKTAFLKHPRRFWLQKGHRARLTQVFVSPFWDRFFWPQMCATAACSALISLILHMIFRGRRRKKTEGIGYVAGDCGKAAHFMIHETVLTVFLSSQPSKVSIFFCRENKLGCQPKKKKAPWYVTLKQFLLHLNSTLLFLWSIHTE